MKYSSNEDQIEGQLSLRELIPICAKASCNRLTIGISPSIPSFPTTILYYNINCNDLVSKTITGIDGRRTQSKDNTIIEIQFNCFF